MRIRGYHGGANPRNFTHLEEEREPRERLRVPQGRGVAEMPRGLDKLLPAHEHGGEVVGRRDVALRGRELEVRPRGREVALDADSLLEADAEVVGGGGAGFGLLRRLSLRAGHERVERRRRVALRGGALQHLDREAPRRRVASQALAVGEDHHGELVLRLCVARLCHRTVQPACTAGEYNTLSVTR